MKNIILCKKMVMEQMDNFNRQMGFVIIRNNDEKIKTWSKMGYDVTYDYILFDDYNEYWKFINNGCGVDYLDNTNKLENDKIIYSKWNGKNEMYDDFFVSLIHDNPYFTIAIKHIMNCDFECAKSYKRHFDKLNGDLWNDYTQTGIYCLIDSRIYCTNHKQFEINDNVEQINGYYKM